MKVLALNSSPRKEGQSKTELMLKHLVNGMQEAGAAVETVHLRNKTIRNCAGCFTCWTKTPGICIHKDDMTKELFPRWLKADLVITWGTSVTRGIAGTLSDHDNPRFINDIPLVFMVVADPIGAQVIVSYEETGRDNVAGTRNRVPESVNINTIRSYFPEFKRLGILYNTNEHNSVVKVKEIESLANKMNFQLVALELELGADGKPKPESIPVRMAELEAAGVDFIYLGSSSFLDVQRDLFTRSAVDHGIPVLSPYERLVRDSYALLSIAARYQDVGKIAGRQVKSILIDGKKPGDLPVLSVDQYAYVVNMTTAKKLNMFPSVEILQIAETVE